MKMLLVDCDGTIRQPKSKAKFINRPDDQESIPGEVEAINHYFQKEYVIVGMTNQAGVAAGHKSLVFLKIFSMIDLHSRLNPN